MKDLWLCSLHNSDFWELTYFSTACVDCWAKYFCLSSTYGYPIAERMCAGFEKENISYQTLSSSSHLTENLSSPAYNKKIKKYSHWRTLPYLIPYMYFFELLTVYRFQGLPTIVQDTFALNSPAHVLMCKVRQLIRSISCNALYMHDSHLTNIGHVQIC